MRLRKNTQDEVEAMKPLSQITYTMMLWPK